MRYAIRKHQVVEVKDVSAGMSCDICGKKSRYEWAWEEPGAGGNHSVIDIEAKIGDVWPEGDFRDHYRVDICPGCFITKVKPAIEALGAKFVEHSSHEDPHEIIREESP